MKQSSNISKVILLLTVVISFSSFSCKREDKSSNIKESISRIDVYRWKVEKVITNNNIEAYRPDSNSYQSLISMVKTNKTIILFIPVAVCNDCFMNIYSSIDSLVKLYKVELFIVSDIESLRNNLSFFKDYNCKVFGMKSSELKEINNSFFQSPFIFLYHHDKPTGVKVLEKNEMGFLADYFKYWFSLE